MIFDQLSLKFKNLRWQKEAYLYIRMNRCRIETFNFTKETKGNQKWFDHLKQTFISTPSRMMQLMSLTPAPMRALAEMETLGPIWVHHRKWTNYHNLFYGWGVVIILNCIRKNITNNYHSTNVFSTKTFNSKRKEQVS